MKKTKWLSTVIVLTLAAVMVWTVPTLAQGRGKGQGCAGQGQGMGPGQGYRQGYGTCPYNQGYQNSQGNQNNNSQVNMGRRGPKGAGPNYQPNTQPSTPPVTQ
jgi:hypothetical protein